MATDDDAGSFAQRLRNIKQRLNRREKGKRAKRRARSRRISRREPENVAEDVAASAKEAREVAGAATKLISTEFGITPSKSKGVIEKVSEAVGEASDEELNAMDTDGDGDPDILCGFDKPLAEEQMSAGTKDFEFTEADEFGGTENSPAVVTDEDIAAPLFDEDL